MQYKNSNHSITCPHEGVGQDDLKTEKGEYMSSVQERIIIEDIDGDQIDVTDFSQLIIAGLNAPRKQGATNANVSFIVEDGVRREAWVNYEFIKQNKISAGFSLWVRNIVNVGDLETHWENAEGDMIAHENAKQRIRFDRELVVQPPSGVASQSFTKFKG
jgi:hypothetical protein